MRIWLPFAVVALMTAACGETKLLGSHTPPDETRVIDGPTLALPPDFNLRPPGEAEDYEAVLRAQKTAEAQRILTGTVVSATVLSATVPAGDAWLVQQAGPADSDIRTTLETEATATPEEEKTFWQRIMGKDDN